MSARAWRRPGRDNGAENRLWGGVVGRVGGDPRCKGQGQDTCHPLASLSESRLPPAEQKEPAPGSLESQQKGTHPQLPKLLFQEGWGCSGLSQQSPTGRARSSQACQLSTGNVTLVSPLLSDSDTW